MAKLSIPLSPRDLGAELQKSFNTLTPDKVTLVLMALEKIALKRPGPESFQVEVSSIQLGKGLKIEPSAEDLLSAPVLSALLGQQEKEALIGLHSRLYAQLFNAKEVAGMAENGDHQAEQQVSKPASRGPKMALSIDERKLLLAVKGAVKGLGFGDLLEVNALSMRSLGALQAAKSVDADPRFKAKCFTIAARDGNLFLDIEHPKSTTVDLVCGLLGGLGFASLMQLNSDLLGLVGKANLAGALAGKS